MSYLGNKLASRTGQRITQNDKITHSTLPPPPSPFLFVPFIVFSQYRAQTDTQPPIKTALTAKFCPDRPNRLACPAHKIPDLGPPASDPSKKPKFFGCLGLKFRPNQGESEVCRALAPADLGASKLLSRLQVVPRPGTANMQIHRNSHISTSLAAWNAV